MNELVLVQLPRTARGALAVAFESVGVRVHEVDRTGKSRMPQPPPAAIRAAVLRHPIDRLQSWYHSRLRAGRPFRPEMWTDWEAAFFTALPTFDRFGAAICSTDEVLRSAAERGLMIWEHQVGCAVPELPTDPSVVDATPPSLPRERSELAEFGLRVRLADEIDRYQQLLALAAN